MPSVFIKTYGCQMNVRDSEQVAQMLQARGYALASHETEADVVLINTCSVRDQAEQKALGKMGFMQSLKKNKPDVVLGFLGCMAQSRGEALLDRLPDVDLVVGTQQFHRVADYVEEIRESGKKRKSIVDTSESQGSQSTIKDHILQPKQVTAFVSIMQGCDMYCTFCIVPYTRGRERGRSIAEIVSEVKTLVASGVKEVTLLGQIVNLYGRREFPIVHGKTPFVQLLYALQEIDGLERIRFTSPHPVGFKQDLVRAYQELPKLCEHVHLPLQSGSNRMLKAMHRSYTREIYLKKIESLRAARPEIAITTDIIVGFPGETEEDFQQTCDLVDQVRFDNAFIFRYSQRKDTPAAALLDQLPESVKEERNQILLKKLDHIAKAIGENLVGTEQEILVEGESKTNAENFFGRTRQNKIVIFEGSERHRGQLLPMKITRSTGFTFYGDPAIYN
ncbi:MAG: tRNA (N6-isopentenyl adenosine(37)-C2)-methylthiotransferase MiaB [Verrucomicrobiae bacterium]|nr:tRNA (N6-isopentenyl adenosine(37)-C2)-methylthiotransferase MiaB [Verrucomicrobiae bacterium]